MDEMRKSALEISLLKKEVCRVTTPVSVHTTLVSSWISSQHGTMLCCSPQMWMTPHSSQPTCKVFGS
jgi:hypothetical protein